MRSWFRSMPLRQCCASRAGCARWPAMGPAAPVRCYVHGHGLWRTEHRRCGAGALRVDGTRRRWSSHACVPRAGDSRPPRRPPDLSAATVNRQLHALVDAGLIVRRPDLVDGGGIGRPKVPLALNRDGLAVAAMHRCATNAARDCRPLRANAAQSRGADAHRRLTGDRRACRGVAQVVSRFSGRRFLWAGVAVGGNVDG